MSFRPGIRAKSCFNYKSAGGLSLLLKASFLVFILLCNVYAKDAKDEAKIYFNSGVEKYLMGNITEAVGDLKKALSLDPANNKIKDFIVKILLDATMQNHIKHNYKRAMEYIEEAKALSPENAKVIEMYNLTGDLLPKKDQAVIKKLEIKDPVKTEAAATPNKTETEVKPFKAEAEPAPIKTEDKVMPGKTEAEAMPVKTKTEEVLNKIESAILPKTTSNEVMPDKTEVKVTTKTAAAGIKKEKEKKAQPPVVKVIYVERTMPAGQLKENEIKTVVKPAKDVMKTVLLVIAVFLFVFSCALLFPYLLNREKLKDITADKKKLEDDNRRIAEELEAMRGNLESEQLTVEHLLKKIEKIKKDEEDKIQEEVESRIKQVEAKVRIELMNKSKMMPGQKDELSLQENIKFLGTVDSIISIDDVNSPRLEAMRERLSLMASSQYGYSPDLTFKFLVDMTKNSNPLMRANVIRALVDLAKPETLDIFLNLNKDPDERVRREFLKNAKKLLEKVNNYEIKIRADYKNKIEEILKKEKNKGEWII